MQKQQQKQQKQEPTSEILRRRLNNLIEPKAVMEYRAVERTVNDLLKSIKENSEEGRVRAAKKRKIDEGLEYDYNDDSVYDALKKTMDELAAIYEPKYKAYIEERKVRTAAYEKARAEERLEREAQEKASFEKYKASMTAFKKAQEEEAQRKL